ncbi:zinc finger CCHC-type and RNA-binding motif-containing protein 1-like [Dermacentor andersoni]|uniref:zinc finger CCHC-type and RNA-binding motif-containing protein 1-like n=1 Tax=Dermacentor albipictus TaxID=60249 RepID=UPI00215506B2|nr:zinc finger CCHC-type and RNA-binding motif-containing protein 1-like [Dermacentor andersoni]
MSAGLTPSKSTVYVSNLPFKLTNNDLHQIFQKYGKVAKVTVMKDKQTWKSKGVAFVLFADPESASKCATSLDNQQLMGRTLRASIAKYNGRAPEFIRRKEYKDKSRCFECGEEGHLSYRCPRNSFGEREAPQKKKKRRKAQLPKEQEVEATESENEEDPALESLHAAIKYEQQQRERESGSNQQSGAHSSSDSRRRIRKSAYFSDEEEFDEGNG